MGTEYWFGDVELCNIVSGLISTHEIPRINWDYVTNDILYCGLLLSFMINLFIFVGELVICLGVIYMVSYGSILVVWCILGMYLVSMGNLMMVLMRIIFYGGLMVV